MKILYSISVARNFIIARVNNALGVDHLPCNTRPSPAGTTENSPPFQRWENGMKFYQVPQGRKKPTDFSFVPPGLVVAVLQFPSIKMLGYSLSPCRAGTFFLSPPIASDFLRIQGFGTRAEAPRYELPES
jgi:hypothetical protein